MGRIQNRYMQYIPDSHTHILINTLTI